MTNAPIDFARFRFVTGPTGSGKTELGILLAQALGAEIISLDSMAVYRGMDIGTAKSTLDERRRVRHHLVDVVDPHEDYSVARYVDEARQAALDAESRNRDVLFVGGTPLYLKALLRGIFSGPPADWELRQSLLDRARHEGPESLHARLASVDAASASRLHPRDTRRVIRALEVWEKTGRSIRALQQQFDRARPVDQCRVALLQWDRAELVKRIDRRVEEMFATGLVAEVEGLLDRDGTLGKTASQAVGYREVIEHLRGEHSLDETLEFVKLRTRQFAKRQMTWFRSLSECRAIGIDAHADPRRIAAEIAAW